MLPINVKSPLPIQSLLRILKSKHFLLTAGPEKDAVLFLVQILNLIFL